MNFDFEISAAFFCFNGNYFSNMKKLGFLLLCFYTVAAFPQQFVVANDKENVVYCGVNNPLSALIEGYPCSSVVLTTDNGKIKKRSCGQFNYKPVKVGAVKIKIWKSNKNKLKKIGEIWYPIKSLPLPVAFLAGVYEDGYIRPPRVEGVYKRSLQYGTAGVRAILKNFDYDAPFQVVSYEVKGLKKGELVFTVNNAGALFNYNVTNHFDALEKGDLLLITNIICKGLDEVERRLEPLEFMIID